MFGYASSFAVGVLCLSWARYINTKTIEMKQIDFQKFGIPSSDLQK